MGSSGGQSSSVTKSNVRAEMETWPSRYLVLSVCRMMFLLQNKRDWKLESEGDERQAQTGVSKAGIEGMLGRCSKLYIQIYKQELYSITCKDL